MIVIAIIGILAGVLYSATLGYLARARDTQRIVDVKNMVNAFEMYYGDFGQYPRSNLHDFDGGSVEPNGAWVNSSHSGSWQSLQDQLVNYLKLPVDPNNKLGKGGTEGWTQVFVYSYFSMAGAYCDGSPSYVMTYSLEVAEPQDIVHGSKSCPGFYDYRNGKRLITIGNRH